MSKHQTSIAARCRCGKCELVLTGTPIVTAACYCESCQKAARKFTGLPHAEQVLLADGGTAFVLQRKDRVRCSRGADHLREYRLTPDAPTRRVVATCCNSPMFLEFKGGHWLSVYRDRLTPEDRPPIEMRTMTAYRPQGVEFHDAIPNHAKFSARFMWRLLWAWAAMAFRAPKIEYVNGKLDG